jgi:hypothetical protein
MPPIINAELLFTATIGYLLFRPYSVHEEGALAQCDSVYSITEPPLARSYLKSSITLSSSGIQWILQQVYSLTIKCQ